MGLELDLFYKSKGKFKHHQLTFAAKFYLDIFFRNKEVNEDFMIIKSEDFFKSVSQMVSVKCTTKDLTVDTINDIPKDKYKELLRNESN